MTVENEQLARSAKEISSHKARIASLESDTASKQERLTVLGGFQAEALNGRETIVVLQDKVASLEAEVLATKRQAGEYKSAAVKATLRADDAESRLVEAQNVASGFKVLIGEAVRIGAAGK